MPVGAQNRSHCEAQHLQLLATLESAEKQSPLTPVGTAVMPAVPAVPPIQALSLALLLLPMLSREGQGDLPCLSCTGAVVPLACSTDAAAQPCTNTMGQTQRPQDEHLTVPQCCASLHTCALISSSLYSDIPYLQAVENTVTQ